MTSPTVYAGALDRAGTPPVRPTGSAVERLGAPLVRPLVADALLLGVAADALLRGGLAGPALPLWFALAALALLALVWRAGRTMPGEATGWLLTAVTLAAATAWRDAPELQFLDVAAAVAALGMAALAIADRRAGLLASRMRDTVWGGARALQRIAAGFAPFVPTVARELFAPGSSRRGSAKPVARAAVIGAVVLLVFGALLRGADPIFASLVSLPDLDVGELASHVVVTGVFAWITAGWSVAALAARPGEARAPATLGFGLGMLDVTAALGAVDILFGAFVVAQLGWFFGGEQFLHARTGLTAAEYARQGFFQMVWVVALVVPLLLTTRAALRPGRALARRHTLLALPMLGLLGVMMVSSVLRLRLYVSYYGLTTERLYALVFMGWLALVLAWLAATVLRDRGRPFVAGAMLTGFGTLGLLNIVAPDAIVARVNVARAELPDRDGRPALDLEHLARLSAEGADRAVRAVLAPVSAGTGANVARADERCDAARALLGRWGPPSRAAEEFERVGAWRYGNAGAAHALELVEAHARELRAVTHESCRPVKERYGAGATTPRG